MNADMMTIEAKVLADVASFYARYFRTNKQLLRFSLEQENCATSLQPTTDSCISRGVDKEDSMIEECESSHIHISSL